jgi:hypothetical protein
MRSLIALTLGLIAGSAAAYADETIPQDPAGMEAQNRDRLAWEKQTLEAAYDRLGKKDPKWDALARRALDLMALRNMGRSDPVVTNEEARVAAKEAVDAGCRDPLVRYFYEYYTDPGSPDYERRIQELSDGLKKGGYPPIRRAQALMTIADVRSSKPDLSDADKMKAGQMLVEVLDLLPRSIAEDPRGVFWDKHWYTILDTVVRFRQRLDSDPKAAFDKVDARLAKIKGIDALRLAVKGNFLLNWGWSARGNGYAGTVSDEQFRVFSARLEEARRTLERSWELSPSGTMVPNTMLNVEKGIGGGDREAMEKWFDRAMRADNSNTDACWIKLDWLDPKWYGDAKGEEMVAFGKACAATKNWGSQIPLLGLEAHYRMRRLMDFDNWQRYAKLPDVWEDFHTVYSGHLERRPNDHILRSRYAVMCFITDHYDLAHEQFQILGDNLQEWTAKPSWRLETMKRFRDEAAQRVAAQKN